MKFFVRGVVWLSEDIPSENVTRPGWLEGSPRAWSAGAPRAPSTAFELHLNPSMTFRFVPKLIEVGQGHPF